MKFAKAIDYMFAERTEAKAIVVAKLINQSLNRDLKKQKNRRPKQ